MSLIAAQNTFGFPAIALSCVCVHSSVWHITVVHRVVSCRFICTHSLLNSFIHSLVNSFTCFRLQHDFKCGPKLNWGHSPQQSDIERCKKKRMARKQWTITNRILNAMRCNPAVYVCMRVRLFSVCFHRNWTISLILKYEQKVSPLSKHMQHKNSKNKAAAAA